MTAPTPAVERAAEALVLQEGVIDWSVLSESMRDTPRDQVREILTAALTDPDDPDSLARTLFVLWAVSENPQEFAFGATEATIWWSDMPEHKRVHWRAVADGLRMMLTGEGS